MKKIILSVAIFGVMMVFSQVKAQPRVSVSIQVGAAPAWIPTGYNNVDYYYLPDIGAYYWVPQRQFIYMDGGRWVFAASLPYRYRTYDLYHGYKVVVNEPRPYLRDNIYRERYGRGPSYYSRPSVRPVYRNNGYYERGHAHDHGRGPGYGPRR